MVDVLGLVLGCYVTAANTADVKAAPGVLGWLLQMYQRIVKVLAAKGYRGDLGAALSHFFAQQGRQVELEISQRPDAAKGFPSRASAVDCGANLDMVGERSAFDTRL